MSNYDGLPKTIRVGPFDLIIEIVDAVSGNDADNVGMHHPGEKIELRKDTPNAVYALNVLLHELNHAVAHSCGISNECDEEHVAQGFAATWVQIYRDNPQLMAWIYRMIPTAKAP